MLIAGRNSDLLDPIILIYSRGRSSSDAAKVLKTCWTVSLSFQVLQGLVPCQAILFISMQRLAYRLYKTRTDILLRSETDIRHYSSATSTHHSIIHLRTFRSLITNPVDYIVNIERLGKHIPAEAYARYSRTSVARQPMSKQASTTERLCFLRGPCGGIIKGQSSSFD
jgi:hypothetical protein